MTTPRSLTQRLFRYNSKNNQKQRTTLPTMNSNLTPRSSIRVLSRRLLAASSAAAFLAPAAFSAGGGATMGRSPSLRSNLFSTSSGSSRSGSSSSSSSSSSLRRRGRSNVVAAAGGGPHLYSGLLPTAPAPLLTTEIDHHHRDIISSLDVEDIRAEIEEERSKRDRASELGRSLSAVFSNYISSIHYAAVTPMIIEAHETAKDKLIQHLTEWPQPPGCREWGLQSAIEQFLIAEGFAHFLKTGKTLSRHQIGADLLHDEE
eukprot:jgi/Bigna1/145397/aug1.98_g20105